MVWSFNFLKRYFTWVIVEPTADKIDYITLKDHLWDLMLQNFQFRLVMCKIRFESGSNWVPSKFTKKNWVLGCAFGNYVQPSFQHCSSAFWNHSRERAQNTPHQSGTFGGSNILEPHNFIFNILERNEEKKVMIKPGFVCHVRVYQMN